MGNAQRSNDEHELPSTQARAHFGQRFRIEIINDRHAEPCDENGVKRCGLPLYHRGVRMNFHGYVTARERHVASLEPWGHRHIKSGGIGYRVPGTLFLTPRPPARAQDHGVTRGNLDARHFFPGLDIPLEYCGVRLQIRHTLQPRNIDQNSARYNAVFQIVNPRKAVLRVQRPFVLDVIIKRVVA